MSNHVINIDFCGLSVRAQTEGHLVCLNDLILVGNKYRMQNDLPLMRVQQILRTQELDAYVAAAAKVWGKPQEELLMVQGRGGQARTMGHISVAIYVAEKMSPAFHAHVIKTFVEGKLLEFRELGATEFANLNSAIDNYLPGREDKESNKGIYINAAKLLRESILGPNATAGDWNTATVAQTHARYRAETLCVDMLRLGMVRDWEHLKATLAML
jgi:hypothetical protein